MNLCWRSEHGIADWKENCTAIGLHLAFTYNYNIYRTRIEQLTILQLGFQLGYIYILYNMRYIRSTISNSHGTINHTAIIIIIIINHHHHQNQSHVQFRATRRSCQNVSFTDNLYLRSTTSYFMENQLKPYGGFLKRWIPKTIGFNTIN